MGLHVYCIVPAGHTVPDDLTGIDGVRACSVEFARLAVWVTIHDAPFPASVEAARIHNAVVSSAMTQDVTPVPIRFGQWFPSSEGAIECLAVDPARWEALLERFAGRAEYGLQVRSGEEVKEQDVHMPAAESGREYMAALARRQALSVRRRCEAERVAAAIEARVGRSAVDQWTDCPVGGEVLVRMAHLVAWSDAAAYHGAIEELTTSSVGVPILPTGPWPPYSFVE